MKIPNALKLLAGVALLTGLSAFSSQAQMIIASDNFDVAFTGFTGRSLSGVVIRDVGTNTDRARSQPNSAEARTGSGGGTESDTITYTLDLSSSTSPELSFWYSYRLTEDGNETITVEFDPGSGTFGLLNTVIVPAKNSSTAPFTEVTTNLTGALTGTDQRIRISANFNSADSDFIFFDDVSVSAVPEPTSAALLGLGAGVLLLRRRRNARA